MNIISPDVAPHFAVRIIDGDKAIGTLDLMPAADAQRALDRIQQTYPQSTLAELDEWNSWTAVTDEQVTRATYAHTTYVVASLALTDLPMPSWDLRSYAPDRVTGRFALGGVEESREALMAFACLLDAGEIVESHDDYGLSMRLPEVIWHGVRFEVEAYVAKHRLPSAAPVECSDRESTDEQSEAVAV